jgi:hypothetical protein
MLTAYCQNNPENNKQRNSRILIHNFIVDIIQVVRRELTE